MTTVWLEKLKKAEKTCLIQDNKQKVHYTFDDGSEMAEDYDVKSNLLLVRKWRKRKTLGGLGNWEFEIGEDLSSPRNFISDSLTESLNNPICTRKDTKQHFQWRIRNLPYPLDNYSTAIDDKNQSLIIKTRNKKYYKTLQVPDLYRVSLPLNHDHITLAHSNNTLIVSYKKPREILDLEKVVQTELQKPQPMRDGDMGCNPS